MMVLQLGPEQLEWLASVLVLATELVEQVPQWYLVLVEQALAAQDLTPESELAQAEEAVVSMWWTSKSHSGLHSRGRRKAVGWR
jgi:hypothetical protein